MPWLCHSFLGLQNPEICQHYVHAPQNVTIEFMESQNPKYDTVVVSWRPSKYGNNKRQPILKLALTLNISKCLNIMFNCLTS